MRRTTKTFGFTGEELRTLRILRTPAQVQDFLEGIPINFETGGETIRSPRRVLRDRTAHCLEGALLGAAVFLLQGRPPLLLDIKAGKKDSEHVVALFKEGMRWGAVSKTNHAVLRYREPVYATVRELAMSYFHEYFLDNGRKTMQSFSREPLDLRKFLRKDWTIAEEDLWYIAKELDALPHEKIADQRTVRIYRKADPIERAAGKLTDWQRPVGQNGQLKRRFV